MALRLNGSSSGYVELEVPADAGSHTLTLPDDGGSSGQYLQTDGSGGLSWQTVTDTTGWTWDTTGTSLTGSSVTITGIPSTATEILVVARSLSDSGGTNWGMRAGTSSGVATSGYASMNYYIGASSGNDVARTTDAWETYGGAAVQFEFTGTARLTKMVGNNWTCVASYGLNSTYTNVIHWQGYVELGGALDRINLFTNSGSFDSGAVYVHYFSP